MTEIPKLRALPVLVAAFLIALPAFVPAPLSAADASDDWVARSNENAKVLLEVQAKYGPEGASQIGIDGLDEQVFQIPPDFQERAEGGRRGGDRGAPGAAGGRERTRPCGRTWRS